MPGRSFNHQIYQQDMLDMEQRTRDPNVFLRLSPQNHQIFDPRAHQRSAYPAALNELHRQELVYGEGGVVSRRQEGFKHHFI